MTSRYVIVAGVVGTALGFLCARVVLVNSGWALVPWALVGLALGWLADTRRTAATGGAAYGFALAYVFMLASYDGQASTVTRLLPFAVFGIFGAGCGATLGLLGLAVSRRSSRAGSAGPATPEQDAAPAEGPDGVTEH